MRPVSGQTIAAFCAMALGAGCVTDGGGGASVSPADSALGERLADTRLDLAATDPVADPAAGPMVMRLRADGTGEMDYAGLSLTYRWQARGDQLCLSDLRLGGIPSDDPAEQCAKVRLQGERITVQGLGPDRTNRRMSGVIAPL